MIFDEIAMNNGVIFQHAYDILNTKMQQGINAMAQGNTEMDGKAPLDAALFVPVVVNCSFACELFLKSMLPANTKGHKLDELFLLLDIDIQNNIKSHTIDEMRKVKSAYCDTDFQVDLTKNNNKFAEWRYFHEGNSQSVSLEFISKFMKSVFDVVNIEKTNMKKNKCDI